MKTKGQRILDQFKEGKEPTDLIEEKFAAKDTIYKYWKKYQVYVNLKEELWKIVYEGV